VDALNLARLLRRFAWARLAVAAVLLVVGVVVSRSTVPGVRLESFVAGLLVTAVSSVGLLALGRRVAWPGWTAWLILAVDAATVTLLVLTSGGATSIFAFSYVLVVIASCVLLSRQGAMVIAAASSLLYVGIVLVGILASGVDPATETTTLAVLTMAMNTGTLLVVAIIAGSLADRYRSAHHELEGQRRDLSDLQAFKDLVFESVGTGLIAIDRAGRITAYNRAAAEITGVAEADAVGQHWTSIFGSAVAPGEILAAIQDDARASRRHELILRRAGGTEVPVAVTFWALRSGTGEAVGLIAVCEDLSSWKQMEARMRHSDRLATVGRMAANIAHEIRNPLASMTGAIEVLARDTETGSSARALAQIVSRESERLDHIIKDLLEYARPAPLVLQPMNLADTLDEVLALLQHRPLADSVRLLRDYGRALPVDADPQRMRQVFWNLCLNAVEAMPEGGELSVRARTEPRRVEVRISDTGRGILAGDLPHIFEPFFSTKLEGSGIGLALVHRIVQDHGGDIDVLSTMGRGTTFTITLPAPDA
jgi:two-component system sensor histidine kinase PilS (NtrC family)